MMVDHAEPISNFQSKSYRSTCTRSAVWSIDGVVPDKQLACIHWAPQFWSVLVCFLGLY